MKGQPTQWEKILANKAADNGLISKMYKQLMQLYFRKIKQLNNKKRKWAADLNRHFFL